MPLKPVEALARILRIAWAGGIGVTVGIGAVALILPAARTMYVGFVALLCVGLLLGSAIGLVLTGFRESLVRGLLCLLVPFYAWYFAIRRWTALKDFFCSSVVGTCLAGLLIVIVPALREDGGPNPPGLGLMMTSGPDTTPSPRDSEHERRLKEVLAAVREIGDTYRRMKGRNDNDAAISRLISLRDQVTWARCPESSLDEVRRLRKLYDEPLTDAVKRMHDEAWRVYEAYHVPVFVPPFHFHLDHTVDTDEYFRVLPPPRKVVSVPPSQPNPPMFPFAAPPPQPSRAVPPPQDPPGPSVTVNVSGTVDEATREAINTELNAIVKELKKSAGFGVGWEQTNGRLKFTVTPVEDPRAFADRITVGTVTRIAGRQIDLAVSPSK